MGRHAEQDEHDHDQGNEQNLDRELDEVLQEIRVVLPGVEVLFAFLFTLPFSQRFGEVTALQRGVYFATLLCTALSTALLIAPSAHRRLLVHQGAKAETVRIATRLVIVGTVLLALATVGVVFVISDVLFGRLLAALVALALGLTIGVLWYVLPFLYRPQP